MAVAALSGFSLFSFQTLYLAFKHFPYEGSATLTPDQFVNPIAQTFRQTDIGRFQVERRSSHIVVVAAHDTRST